MMINLGFNVFKQNSLRKGAHIVYIIKLKYQNFYGEVTLDFPFSKVLPKPY